MRRFGIFVMIFVWIYVCVNEMCIFAIQNTRKRLTTRWKQNSKEICSNWFYHVVTCVGRWSLVGAYFMIQNIIWKVCDRSLHTYKWSTFFLAHPSASHIQRPDICIRLFCVRINICAIQLFAHFSLEFSSWDQQHPYHYTNITLIIYRPHFRTQI